jgi:UDP-2-acetamido-3-amino-2,3-dideoxy-glucuronate N-acetyltransferase
VPGPVVHPKGLCESSSVGPRTRVWAFAHVMAGAVVGADCNLGDHSFIEDGATIGDRVTVKNGVAVWRGVSVGDDAFLGPYVTFTNDLRPRSRRRVPQDQLVPTFIGRGASLGANATIVCGLRVGEHAFVGAGAVVTKDVEDHALVVGNPARRMGWVCECGERLDDALACASCGRAYEPTATGLRARS